MTAPPDLEDLALDTPRPSPSAPATRDLARSAARVALAAAWRSLHPEQRERFSTAPQPAPAVRYYAETDDGWACPLWRIAAAPGSSGEPVLLAHGLALNRHSLDYAPELSLARGLSEAGYEVFLIEHRGVRGAIPPEGARPFDADDIATQDLPAALDKVRILSGARRPLFVGHALGGQALYALMGQLGEPGLAAACTLCAALRFPQPRSRNRALTLARLLLPPGAQLPVRAVSALLSPLAQPGEGGLGALGWEGSSGDIARGVLLHGREDLGGAMVKQVLRWVESGTLCDRTGRLDYAEALRDQQLPLMVISAQGDSLASPECCELALAMLRGPQERLRLDSSWGHMDPLLDPRAARVVLPPLLAWLQRWREACW